MNDEIVARELIKIATLLIEARVDIQARYNHWNQAVFDGKLPAVPVKWGRSKVWGGICRGTTNKYLHTGTVKNIEISDFIVDDLNVIDGILLHEMIHAEMYLEGLSGHGYEFLGRRRDYTVKSGVAIPFEEGFENFVVPEDMEAKPKGIVVQEVGSRKGMVVYNLKFFNNSFNALKEYYEKIADMHRQNGVQMKATFLISKVKELLKYPEKRSLMRGYYEVPDSLISEVLSQGQPIAQVVA